MRVSRREQLQLDPLKLRFRILSRGRRLDLPDDAPKLLHDLEEIVIQEFRKNPNTTLAEISAQAGAWNGFFRDAFYHASWPLYLERIVNHLGYDIVFVPREKDEEQP